MKNMQNVVVVCGPCYNCYDSLLQWRGGGVRKRHTSRVWRTCFLKKRYLTEKKVHFQSPTILIEEFLILQCLYFQWNLDTQNTTSRNGRLNNTCLFFYFFNPGALMISMFRYTTVSFLQNMPPTPPPLFLMITLITSLLFCRRQIQALQCWGSQELISCRIRERNFWRVNDQLCLMMVKVSR